MLIGLQDLMTYDLQGPDGKDVGTLVDLYFDDHYWVVRYLVVDTGHWLPGRKVLLSPDSVGRPDIEKRVLPVTVDHETIEQSPAIDTKLPVSRKREHEVVDYFGWVPYWLPISTPAPGAQMTPVGDEVPSAIEDEQAEAPDKHLRSYQEVLGYHLHTSDDEEFGHVENLIMQSDGWVVRYLVIDTGNWLPGKRVLISPTWVAEVSWEESWVRTTLVAEQVKESPEFEGIEPPDRQYEQDLFNYYGLPPYWG